MASILRARMMAENVTILVLHLQLRPQTAFRTHGLRFPHLETLDTNLPHRVVGRLLDTLSTFAPCLQDLTVGVCVERQCSFQTLQHGGIDLIRVDGPPLCAAYLAEAFLPLTLHFQWDDQSPRRQAALLFLAGLQASRIAELSLFFTPQELRIMALMAFSGSGAVAHSLDTLLLQECSIQVRTVISLVSSYTALTFRQVSCPGSRNYPWTNETQWISELRALSCVRRLRITLTGARELPERQTVQGWVLVQNARGEFTALEEVDITHEDASEHLVVRRRIEGC